MIKIFRKSLDKKNSSKVVTCDRPMRVKDNSNSKVVTCDRPMNNEALRCPHSDIYVIEKIKRLWKSRKI